KRAAAAQRTRRPVDRRRDRNAITAGGEDGERRIEVLALEVAIEGVGEEDHFSFPPPARGGGRRAQHAGGGKCGGGGARGVAPLRPQSQAGKAGQTQNP